MYSFLEDLEKELAALENARFLSTEKKITHTSQSIHIYIHTYEHL